MQAAQLQDTKTIGITELNRLLKGIENGDMRALTQLTDLLEENRLSGDTSGKHWVSRTAHTLYEAAEKTGDPDWQQLSFRGLKHIGSKAAAFQIEDLRDIIQLLIETTVTNDALNDEFKGNSLFVCLSAIDAASEIAKVDFLNRDNHYTRKMAKLLFILSNYSSNQEVHKRAALGLGGMFNSMSQDPNQVRLHKVTSAIHNITKQLAHGIRQKNPHLTLFKE